MILTPTEYSHRLKINGKTVSSKTVQRRCENNQLPYGHKARKIRGAWAIEVKESLNTGQQ